MMPLLTDFDCIAGFGNEKKEMINWNRNTSLAELVDGGNIFMVGDSLVEQLCLFGSPGLCDSTVDKVNLKANGDDDSNHTTWKFLKDEWLHLVKKRPRGFTKDLDRYGRSEAFVANPDAKHTTPGRLLKGFIDAHSSSDPTKDILIIGLVGNHFTRKADPGPDAASSLTAFERYSEDMMKVAVNSFNGKVVIMNYSPQHFGLSGAYGFKSIATCSPTSLIPAKFAHIGVLMKVIWEHAVFKYTMVPYVFLNMYDLLNPLWSCHRSPHKPDPNSGRLDCTHWRDSVITLMADLVLNALQEDA